jgi:hypothetical protein
MLQTVMRPSIESARIVLPANSTVHPVPPAGTDPADDRQRHILRRDAARERAFHGDAHVLHLLRDEALRREDVLHLGSADPVRKAAECAVRAGVRVAADDGHSRQRGALLGPDHVHDPLTLVEEREIGLGAVLAHVGVERLHLDARSRIFDSLDPALPPGRRRVVVGGCDHGFDPPRPAARGFQALVSLRAGDLVHEMPVDIQQRRAAFLDVHDVTVPKLVVEGSSAHVKDSRNQGRFYRTGEYTRHIGAPRRVWPAPVDSPDGPGIAGLHHQCAPVRDPLSPLNVESPTPVRSDPSVLRNVLWKFGIPLLVALGGATYLAIPFADRVLTEWFQADVDMRAQLVFNSIEEGLQPLFETRSEPQIRRYLARHRERPAAGGGGGLRSRQESAAQLRRRAEGSRVSGGHAPRLRPSSWCRARRACCTSQRFPLEKFSQPKATASPSCTTWASSTAASRERATTWWRF